MRILSISGIIVLFTTLSVKAQLKADAGPDKIVCPDSSVQIGGTVPATGGLGPYTYLWTPKTGLSDPKASNPTAKPVGLVNYILEITDATGAIAKDSVMVSLSYINEINAGPNVGVCDKGTVTLGDINNISKPDITYSWVPAAGLSDAAAPRPVATVTTTTTYTLTATQTGCPAKTDIVTIVVIPTPVINAGSDVTITEGESTMLIATGGIKYEWSPTVYLSSDNTATTVATPPVTTTYTVKGSDATGTCSASAIVTVLVIPKVEIFIYNTFTPNHDKHNDWWTIDNISKFPKNTLEVYNRNGKLVYKAKGYLNTWDGKAFGTELPAATYFYILDLGDGSPVYHGTVTIIR